MNILINDYCNLKCPYCFAEDVMESARCNPMRSMSMDNFNKVLDFAYESGQKTVRILGGEPTLHPQFKEIITKCLEDNRFDGIMLFSNCVFEEDTLNFLIESNKKKHIGLLPNCNEKEVIGEKRYNLMVNNIKALSQNGIVDTVGINIYKSDMDVQYIFDIAKEVGAKTIRWSITVPNKPIDNNFDVIAYFKDFGPLLEVFLTKIRSYNLKSGIDCNKIPLCAFDDDTYQKLVMLSPKDFNLFACKPIIDIKPDLTAIRCFGMSEHCHVKVSDVKNTQELSKIFDAYFEEHTKKELIPQCQNCITYKRSGNKSCGCIKYRDKEENNAN